MALAVGQVALTSCRLGKLRLDAARLNAVLAPPVAASTPVPAHGATAGPYVLAWTAGAGTSSVDVYFGTSATPPLVSSAQAGNTYTLPALTAGQVYYWRIVSRNTFGTTSSPTWSFTAQLPIAVTPVVPTNGATGVPNVFTLQWTAATAEPGLTYTLYFGTTSPPPFTISGLPSNAYGPIGPLANNTTYFWRVGSVNNAGETLSGIWTFTTWVLLAPTPYLAPSPSHGQIDVSVRPTFAWTAVSNATHYNVFLGIGTNPPFVVSVTATSYTPPADLGSGSTYYWRIESSNAGGVTSGPTWSFLTIDVTKLFILINGAAAHVRIRGLTIRDQLNDAPNTCAFLVDGTAPEVGQTVHLGLGSTTGTALIFGGSIEQVEQVYEGGRPVLHAWLVSCLDWWRRLNRYSVLRHYTEQSATAIVQNLVSNFGWGFTGTAIAAGLPTITGGIDFTGEQLGECLRRVMQLVGGSWYVDYSRDVHAFLTEATTPPDALVPGLPTLLNEPAITWTTDLSQVRTRVFVIGGGSQTITDIAAAQDTIPLEDATWFKPTGGVAQTGTQRIPHTGVVTGGGGTTIKGYDDPAVSASAPIAAIAIGIVGGIVGAAAYRVSFKSPAGETAPGLVSGTVTGAATAAPASGPTAALTGPLGRIVGTNYTYQLTYVTDRGETLVSPASSPVSPAAFPVPTGTLTVNAASGIGYLIGAYSYRVTFVTASGETTGGTATSRTASALSGPAAPSVDTSLAAHLNGPLKGDYRWRVSFVTAIGETLGAASGSITVAATTAAAPSIAGDGTGQTIGIRVAWISQWGESDWSPVSTDTNHGSPPIVTPLAVPAGVTHWIIFSTGSYTGSPPASIYRLADVFGIGDSGSVPVAPVVTAATKAAGTMGRKAGITLATGPTGTVARRLYRTKAGGSEYFLVTEIPNNTTTTYTDVMPDAALTVPAPFQNLNGEQHQLAGIATGTTGTVARRVYRTKAGGSEYRLLVELPDNTTTTFVDNTPDTGLGQALLPVVNTAGGENVNLTIATGPAGTLARRIYRTKSGGASGYFFLGELTNNTATTFLDSRLDTELGEAPPLVNGAGASAVNVTAIPSGGAGITARRLWRLDLVGVYRFVTEIKDNVTSTFLDTLADTELGDPAPTVSTIGALPGATAVLVDNTAPFQSAGGWFTSGSQVVRYSGISGSTLTGIPSSGPGSLVAALKAGDELIAAAMLTGTTISEAIARGDSINVRAEMNDTAAQAALAALEGDGNGIYEHLITDSRLGWKEAEATGTADLQLFARPIVKVNYSSRDPKTRSGKRVSIALPSIGLSGDFLIQAVTIDEIGIVKGLFPRYQVEASSVQFTFEDLLRQLLTPPAKQ